MRPRVGISGTQSSSTGGEPLYYDSGIKYDDPNAYYDRWYDVSGNLVQGEMPAVTVEKTSPKIDIIEQ